MARRHYFRLASLFTLRVRIPLIILLPCLMLICVTTFLWETENLNNYNPWTSFQYMDTKNNGTSSASPSKRRNRIEKPVYIRQLDRVCDHHSTSSSSVSAREQFLEFVHIPKTAGSTIERVGAAHNITWGGCHFPEMSTRGVKQCPPADLGIEGRLIENLPPFDQSPDIQYIHWHVPPHKWKPNYFQQKCLFTVVRNPYELVLSTYYDRFGGYGGRYPNRPRNMNKVIQELLVQPIGMYGGRFVPQSDFVFDDNGTQVIPHVLKMESLSEDFDRLMATYHLSHVSVGTERYNKRNTARRVLTIHHFTNRTIQLIQERYRRDFEMLDYPLNLPVASSPKTELSSSSKKKS